MLAHSRQSVSHPNPTQLRSAKLLLCINTPTPDPVRALPSYISQHACQSRVCAAAHCTTGTGIKLMVARPQQWLAYFGTPFHLPCSRKQLQNACAACKMHIYLNVATGRSLAAPSLPAMVATSATADKHHAQHACMHVYMHACNFEPRGAPCTAAHSTHSHSLRCWPRHPAH